METLTESPPIRLAITSEIKEIAQAQGKSLAPLTDDLILLESGLDSLCFAILVARLEDSLGFDPFTAADDGNGWQPTDRTTPEQSFEWRWAMTLLEKVMNQLAADYAAQGNGELFNVLKPCLLGERDAQPYKTLAAQLKMTEGSIKVAVHRLRQNYRAKLRAEIADTVNNPAEVDDELRHLFSVLAR